MSDDWTACVWTVGGYGVMWGDHFLAKQLFPQCQGVESALITAGLFFAQILGLLIVLITYYNVIYSEWWERRHSGAQP